MTDDTYTAKSAYAEALALLATCLRVPNPVLYEAVSDGSLFEAFADIMGVLAEDGPADAFAAQAREQADRPSPSSYDELRTDYTRLFTHPVSPRVPIYESQFARREEAGEKKPLLVVNRTAEAVDALYRAKGFAPDRKEVVSGDHLSAELAFLSLLLNEELEEDGSHGEGEGAVSAQVFFAEHLKPWAASFFEEVHQQAETPEYQMIGQFGQNILSLGLPA